MARLRNAIGQALLGLSEELTANRVRKERLADYQAQQDIMLSRQLQFLKEQDALREAAATRAALLNRAKELEQRQFDTLSALPKRAGDLSESLPALVEEARQVGVTDPAMGTGGASITIPDDPRLGEKYRGETITHYARPIDPTTGQLREERTPIEELIRIRQQAEQRDKAARDQAERERVRLADEEEMREFRAATGIDEEGTEFIEGPGGLRKQTGLSAQQAARRAGLESGARAAADPAIVSILGPDGSTNALARVRPTGEPDVFAAAPLSASAASGAANPTQARANAVRPQFERFKGLVEKINTAGPGIGRITKGLTNQAQRLTRAEQEEYERIRQPLGLTLAVIIQGARPTDTDAAIAARMLPDFFTSKPVAESLLKNVEAALDAAVAANRARGVDVENMTLEELIAAAEAGQLAPGTSLREIIAASEGAGVISAEEFLSGGDQ